MVDPGKDGDPSFLENDLQPIQRLRHVIRAFALRDAIVGSEGMKRKDEADQGDETAKHSILQVPAGRSAAGGHASALRRLCAPGDKTSLHESVRRASTTTSRL